MRNTVFALSILGFGAALAGGATPAFAKDYAYCLQSRNFGTDCRYSSFAQCRATASGLGADCILNPRIAFREQAEPEQQPRRRARPAPRD